MSEVTKIYVEILYPGILFSEPESREVKSRNTMKIAKSLKHAAFAFKFYDQVETTILLDGKPKVVAGDRKNESGMYYPDGQIFTLEEVKMLKPAKDYSILASNMEGNNYPLVVKTRVGSWQPFYPDKDEVILL
jgi:thymidylate kinase